jgi:hypothetical protein
MSFHFTISLVVVTLAESSPRTWYGVLARGEFPDCGMTSDRVGFGTFGSPREIVGLG